MRKFKVNIWHANSNEALLSSSLARSSARSPSLDITLSHTLKHTLEVEAEDSLAACSKALANIIASYPSLPELEPGQIRTSIWDKDRRTDASDIFIVFDFHSEAYEGEFLYCGDRSSDSFVKIQMLGASLSGHEVH